MPSYHNATGLEYHLHGGVPRSMEGMNSVSRPPLRLTSATRTPWCRSLAVAMAMLATAATLAGRQQPPVPLPDGYTIGEALSSSSPEDSIEFSRRMFTVPDLNSRCPKARASEVVQLHSEVLPLRLRVGQPFRPGSLKIVALSASGAVLPNIPLGIDVSGPEAIFSRENLDKLPDGSMTPVTPAHVQFRVRTICPGGYAETFVSADIVQK